MHPVEVELAWLEARYSEIARPVSATVGMLAVLVFPYPALVPGRRESTVAAKLVALGARAGWACHRLQGTGSRPARSCYPAQVACRDLVPAPCEP